MTSESNVHWIVDAHVHLHQCFGIASFLDSARHNLAALAGLAGMDKQAGCKTALLFTESFGDDGFGTLSRAGRVGPWTLNVQDDAWIVARHDDQRAPIHIASGRQIVTRERLEVAALGTTRVVADGQPMEQVIDNLLSEDALLVLPWGFGKWMGNRGKIVERMLERYGPERLLLGDNGGRAALSTRPPLFSLAESTGRIVIAGTDPLPFATESARVGSYASLVQAGDAPSSLMQTLRTLRKSPPILGRRASLPYFVKSQVRMQLRKSK
jgi:hypothetical protein